MAKRYISGAVLVMVLLLSFAGCSIIAALNTPPDMTTVQQKFVCCYDNIQTIVDFMIVTGYHTIYINDSGGKMKVDSNGTMQMGLQEIMIEDTRVCAALDQLLGGKEYISISKHGNTINFTQWSGSQDIGCGIAYSINGTDRPEIQFMTELIPLDEEGWFYYVDDYNKWRAQH